MTWLPSSAHTQIAKREQIAFFLRLIVFIEIQLAVILIPSRRHHQSFFQMKKKINSFDSIILWVRSRTQRIVCNLAEMWFDLFLFTLNYFFFSIINDLSNQSIQFEMLFFLRNSSRFFFFFSQKSNCRQSIFGKKTYNYVLRHRWMICWNDQ